MKKLRTAVIGLGRIGWMYHIPEIAAHSGFELVGVCDSLPERLGEAKQLYNVNTYSDVDVMLENQSPDLVVVASPTKFHLSHTMAAFKAGCDVFCEKPAMASVDEMEIVLSGMKEYGRRFMVYQPHRGGSDLQCLKDILHRGLLGKVYMIKRTRCDYSRRSDWQAFAEFGGGMLNNYGSHIIDQMLHLANSPIEKVYCAVRKIASLGDADDVVKVVLESVNDMVLDIDINMAAALPVQSWIVFGQYGTASLDDENQIWNVRYFNPAELEDISAAKELAAKGRSYASGETIKWYTEKFMVADYPPLDYYQQCYKYFAMGEKPLVPCGETMLLMQTLHECRRQAYN